MDTNYIIKFNEELESISALIMELVIIGKYSHKEEIVNFITKTDLAETKYNFVA